MAFGLVVALATAATVHRGLAPVPFASFALSPIEHIRCGSSDGHWLATQEQTWTHVAVEKPPFQGIRIWNLAEGRFEGTVYTRGYPRVVRLSAKHGVAVVAAEHAVNRGMAEVQVVDLRDANPRFSLPVEIAPPLAVVQAVLAEEDGVVVALTTVSGELRLVGRDLKDGRRLWSVPTRAVAIKPLQDDRCLVATWDDGVQVIEARSGRTLSSFGPESRATGRVYQRSADEISVVFRGRGEFDAVIRHFRLDDGVQTGEEPGDRYARYSVRPESSGNNLRCRAPREFEHPLFRRIADVLPTTWRGRWWNIELKDAQGSEVCWTPGPDLTPGASAMVLADGSWQSPVAVENLMQECEGVVTPGYDRFAVTLDRDGNRLMEVYRLPPDRRWRAILGMAAAVGSTTTLFTWAVAAAYRRTRSRRRTP